MSVYWESMAVFTFATTRLVVINVPVKKDTNLRRTKSPVKVTEHQMQLITVHFNPLRSNSDHRQISLCNIDAFSVREIMRIKDIITQY